MYVYEFERSSWLKRVTMRAGAMGDAFLARRAKGNSKGRLSAQTSEIFQSYADRGVVVEGTTAAERHCRAEIDRDGRFEQEVAITAHPIVQKATAQCLAPTGPSVRLRTAKA